MRVEVNTTSACKREVHIELPAEQVTQAFNRTYAQFARQVAVPGFRPGKAPQNVIRNRFGKEVRDEVMRTLVPQVVRDAVVEHKLAVVGEPSVDDLTLLDGHPMKLKLHCEVIPEIDLGEYRGLQVTKKISPVTDETVESVLLRMREAQSSLVPVEEERPAQDGDFVEFALTGYALAEGSDAPGEEAQPEIPRHVEEIKLGNPGVIPAFNEHLRGTQVGATCEFPLHFEEQHGVPSLVGKRVFCQLEVLSLRVQELPEMDDAFAQGLPGEFQNLEDLQQKIRTRLEKDAERTATEQVHEALLSQLVERTGLEVPEVMVQERSKERLQMLAESLFSRGYDPQMEKIDWKGLLQAQEVPARRDVQHAIILAKIGALEHIDATEDEVRHEIVHLAEHTGETPAAAKARLTKEGGVDSIRDVLRHKKTLQFLLENASISIETVTPSDSQSTPGE